MLGGDIQSIRFRRMPSSRHTSRLDADITHVASSLRSATRIVALTGAGISAESGVPTFRAAQSGLWARYDPMELATPEAFAANPELVWDWYCWRRELVSKAKPNSGHHALAVLEKQAPAFVLVTQNVDRLHHRAGSKAVVELHGNLEENRCSREHLVAEQDPRDTRRPPHCPRCDARLRPNVVWFGEALPAAALERAMNAAQHCDLLLCIGTSNLVYPAAAIPGEALNGNAIIVEINPETTPLSTQATHHLKGSAGAILPQLISRAYAETPTIGFIA